MPPKEGISISPTCRSVADASTTRSFGYAADDSVVSDDRGADVFGFAYDAAGRLAGVAKNSAPEASYATTPSVCGSTRP